MTPTIPDGWGDFFVATAGAAGALCGLIIVAMTVNIAIIIASPGMTSRAAATIASLVLIVVSAAAGLIPAQGVHLLGAEILVFTLVVAGLEADSGVRMLRAAPRGRSGTAWAKAALAAVQVIPFAFGSCMLLAGSWDGLYWIAAGVILVFIGSITNAWVLLVEVLR